AQVHGKGKDAGVFEKKLPLLRVVQLVRSEIELLHVHIAVGEIRVGGEIRHEIGTQSDLDIDATCVKPGRSRSQTASGRIGRQMVKAPQSIWLDDEQAPDRKSTRLNSS